MSDWPDQWEALNVSEKPKSGGQGSVIQVRHRSDGRVGALKRLHDEHQKSTERRYRMQQEVNALLALDGGGTPRILDSNTNEWQDKSIPLWVVMEWIPGKTLQQQVNSSPLALDEAVRLVEQLLITVDECHKLGIHHRDLKPDNVLLRDSDRQLILVDFGMSWTKIYEEDEREYRTGSDQEIGNRFLRLPEHAAGRHSHNDASDLSMVVGLLFFMLTATAPRVLQDSKGRMPHEVSEARFGALLNDIRWARLRRIFNIAFNFHIEQRFQKAGDILERLKNLFPAEANNEDSSWREELELIADLKASDYGRRVEAGKSLLLEASRRFLSKYQGNLGGTGFVSGGNGPSLVEGNRAAEFTFMIVPEGGSNPSVAYTHRLELSDAQIKASVAIEGQAPDNYYTGFVADVDSLYEAVEKKVGPVLTVLLKKMRDKLAGFYGA